MDTRIGRWISVDRVVQPYQSPYCSMDNDPVVYNDPMGDKIKAKRKVRRAMKRAARQADRADKTSKAMDKYRRLKTDDEVHEFHAEDGADAIDALNKACANANDPDFESGESIGVDARTKESVKFEWSTDGEVEASNGSSSRFRSGNDPKSVNIGMLLEYRSAVQIAGQPETPDEDVLTVDGFAMENRITQLPLSTLSVVLNVQRSPSPDVIAGRENWVQKFGALSASIDERTMVAAYAIHTISIMVDVMVPQGSLGRRIWKKADRPSWAVGPEYKLKK